MHTYLHLWLATTIGKSINSSGPMPLPLAVQIILVMLPFYLYLILYL